MWSWIIKKQVLVLAITDIEVEYGTAYADIDFPDEVEVTVEDEDEVEDTMDVDVDWADAADATPAYDGDTAGDYVFAGELVLPANITNPDDLEAEVTVVVAAEIVENEMWLRMENWLDDDVDTMSFKTDDDIYFLAGDDSGQREFDLLFENLTDDAVELYFQYNLLDDDGDVVESEDTGGDRVLLDDGMRTPVFTDVDWTDLEAEDHELRMYSKEVEADSYARFRTFENIYVGAVQLMDDDGVEQYETYATVGPALADADEEYTATLFADIECTPTISHDEFVLDLNGFELDGDVTIDAEDVEIEGSTITGDIIINDGMSVKVDADVTIEGDVVLMGADSEYEGPDPEGEFERPYLVARSESPALAGFQFLPKGVWPPWKIFQFGFSFNLLNKTPPETNC